jgi:hypothetical protein
MAKHPICSSRRSDSAALLKSRVLVLAFALAMPGTAAAKAYVLFHSFNGSVFARFPHTFVELSGTLDGSGRIVHENYGYPVLHVTPAVLAGNVRGAVEAEDEEYSARPASISRCLSATSNITTL